MSLTDSLGAAALTFTGPCLCLGLLAACAKQLPSAPPLDPGPHPLQGRWEGDGDSAGVTMTIAGDSLYFYARPDFQYDTIFTLAPDTDPPELHATILDSPRTTDSVGERVIAIYAFKDGALDIAVVDKPDGAPVSFDKNIARYHFARALTRE